MELGTPKHMLKMQEIGQEINDAIQEAIHNGWMVYFTLQYDPEAFMWGGSTRDSRIYGFSVSENPVERTLTLSIHMREYFYDKMGRLSVGKVIRNIEGEI
jgi:hypothetical protein